MARTPDQDGRRPKGKAREAAVWVLMSLLILGLGGFGVTSFSGGVTTVAHVGDAEISTDDYARAFQEQVSAFSRQVGQPISSQEALAVGLDRQALQRLITRAALDNEADRIGLSVGDATVATQLMQTPAFQGVSGSFDREAYRFVLERANQSEREYESGLRRDITRSLLQGIIANGFAAPPVLTHTIYAWAAERRAFSMLRLGQGDLAAPLPEPTEDDLSAYYQENIAAFTRPEAKRITYAALLPEAIASDQLVDDAVLKALYEDRIDEFVIPERRLVERLVYPDQAAADAARAALDSGASFEQLVAERGLTLDAIDLGDQTREDLGEAGDAVFAVDQGGVAGPVMTPLGPALFRVSNILAAEETSFEEARPTLAIEMQTDAARRHIADQVEVVDDLLASGASLEDLASEAGLELGTLDHVPGAQGDALIEGYPAFRTAADAVQEGDFPQAIVLEDGGLVALRLDQVVPAAPIPFAEAREDVAAAWRADMLATALSARAAEIKAAVDAGASLGSFGVVDVTADIGRDGFVADAPDSLMTDVFAMAEGDTRVIEADGFVAMVRLDGITPAATEGEEAEALRSALVSQAREALAADAFTAYTAALSAEAGISIDQAAINAVNAGLP